MYKFIFIFIFFLSCSGSENDTDNEDMPDPIDKIIPTNLVFNVEIKGADNQNPYGDGSGTVKFTASATNAVNYSFRFGTGDVVDSSSGSIEYTYSEFGTKSYITNVLAYSSSGDYISEANSITVYVKANSDDDLLEIITGGSEKTWKINAAYDAHFGNGNKQFRYTTWWEAPSFSKNNSGFYDDEYSFKSDGTYIHKTNGNVYGKSSHLISTYGNTGQNANSAGEIENFNLNDYEGSFYVKKENNENKVVFDSKSFIGFYVGQHTYTIECYDANNILVRTVDNQDRAWYIWLTDKEVSTTPSKDIFTDLVWSDDFNYNGKLNADKWVYEVRNQWYNQELQATTDRLENVIVENGVLKIIAKREGYGGKNFTSGRVKTNTKFDFTYGRVDIRAKLPGKKGTWPALWLLGSNYDQIDWPSCGEIDIMEHAGNRLNKIQGTVHHPDNYGGGDGGETYDYNNVSTEFHIYSVVWTEKGITFLVDDKPFHIVGNACSLPFNWDFFIIINIAMGGTFGGSVPSDFSSDVMEVDYVKIYQ